MCSKLDVSLLTEVVSINYNTILALEIFHMFNAGFSRQKLQSSLQKGSEQDGGWQSQTTGELCQGLVFSTQMSSQPLKQTGVT